MCRRLFDFGRFRRDDKIEDGARDFDEFVVEATNDLVRFQLAENA